MAAAVNLPWRYVEGYNAVMQAVDVAKLTHPASFTPFRIRMTSGETYDVRHPEMALVSRSWVQVLYFDEHRVVHDFRFLSLTQIRDIEMLSDDEPAARKNRG